MVGHNIGILEFDDFFFFFEGKVNGYSKGIDLRIILETFYEGKKKLLFLPFLIFFIN